MKQLNWKIGLALPGLLLCLLLAAAPVSAQDDAAAPSEGLGKIGKNDTSLGEFEHLLKPYDKDELAEIAGAWMEELKRTVKALSAARIDLDKDSSDADATARAERLLTARTAVIDRFNLVLVALENKGGDIADFKKYISAVSGITEDAKNISIVATYLLNWVQSPEGGIRWGKNIVFFLLTLIVFKILSSIIGGVVAKTLKVARVKVSDLLKDFFINTARKLTFFIGIVVALSMLEVNIVPFLAAIGAAGFVIGFALQGTLSNFAAGIMILFYRPYDLGEVVTVAGVTGKVDEMSLVSTTLKTPDNQTLIIPNGSIWGDIITNITGSATRRVDLIFGIGYSDSIEKAQGLLEEIVKAHPLVLPDPAPVIKVHELADSSVNFVCRPWSKTSDYWDVYWDLTRQVKEKFDEEGISIPFPQTDVHLHKVEG